VSPLPLSVEFSPDAVLRFGYLKVSSSVSVSLAVWLSASVVVGPLPPGQGVDMVGAELVQTETDTESAEDLGVSRRLIGYAVDELDESGKLRNVTQFTTNEKREQVRAYIEEPAGDE